MHLRKQTCRVVKCEVDTAGMEPNFLNDDMTPYHIFELFWDVIKHTVNMTHVCAAQKGNANFQVTADELQGVLAILSTDIWLHFLALSQDVLGTSR